MKTLAQALQAAQDVSIKTAVFIDVTRSLSEDFAAIEEIIHEDLFTLNELNDQFINSSARANQTANDILALINNLCGYVQIAASGDNQQVLAVLKAIPALIENNHNYPANLQTNLDLADLLVRCSGLALIARDRTKSYADLKELFNLLKTTENDQAGLSPMGITARLYVYYVNALHKELKHKLQNNLAQPANAAVKAAVQATPALYANQSSGLTEEGLALALEQALAPNAASVNAWHAFSPQPSPVAQPAMPRPAPMPQSAVNDADLEAVIKESQRLHAAKMEADLAAALEESKRAHKQQTSATKAKEQADLNAAIMASLTPRSAPQVGRPLVFTPATRSLTAQRAPLDDFDADLARALEASLNEIQPPREGARRQTLSHGMVNELTQRIQHLSQNQSQSDEEEEEENTARGPQNRQNRNARQ